MDPLSDVLSLLKPRSYAAGGYGIASDIAIQWPKHSGIKCYAMVSGQCWLTVEGVAEPVLITAGDCFLLPRGLPHDDPGHPWTLQKLAERVGMSRSVFALRFKETVGTTPMEYLTRWRMMLAGERLMNAGESISEIAASLGYESDSAFGKAFRRVMGCSPRQHSRGGSRPTKQAASSAESSYEDQMQLAAQ